MKAVVPKPNDLSSTSRTNIGREETPTNRSLVYTVHTMGCVCAHVHVNKIVIFKN